MGGRLQVKHFCEFGVFRLDPDSRLLFKNGQLVPLSPKTLAVLAMLVENRRAALVEKETLLGAVWPGVFVEESNLTHHISVLRKALGNGMADQTYIETVPRRGYRFVAPVTEPELLANGAQTPPAASRKRPFTRAASLVALAILVAGAAWAAVRYAQIEWARKHALPDMRRLVETSDLSQAFRMARQIERYLPGDPEIEGLRRQHGVPIDIKTDPPGADVYLKSYHHVGDDWEWLGKSPIQALSVPAAARPAFRLRMTKPGFETVERMMGWWSLNTQLFAQATSPPGMVRVEGGEPLIPGIPKVRIPEYWIDKYEVTNKEYKRFIDAGGYRRRELWKHPFEKDGRTLSWEEAMAELRDTTGRPGPATWEAGIYPKGHAEHPVGGVSWYEAAAYAEFSGKSLPTIYHWYAAVELIHLFYPMVMHSNFAGQEPASVGKFPGLGFNGTYDMGGNVREWCFNGTENRRFILGGAWNEQGYSCLDPMRLSPFDRSATNGLRCIKSQHPTPNPALRQVEFQFRDVLQTKPVSEPVFQAYKALYTYDRSTELQPLIESTDEEPYWRHQKITFNAAYGRERVLAHLFLPRNVSPPYQAIVFCPGQTAVYIASSEHQFPAMLEFLIHSGRAVLFPVYKETYERRTGAEFTVGNAAERDRVIWWAKDLSRSVDYLETRSDIDRNRLAFVGVSLGSYYGPVLTTVESRFKASLLIAGGLIVQWTPQPEVDPFHFAPRNHVPTLMVNGRNDFLAPLELSQAPLFRLLGAPAERKRHAILAGGHTPAHHHEMVRESLDWLNRYLAPEK
jgi:DNA-binding winged helix-turn-helix (wHTH) protein/dienelactone hydrolase